MNLLNLSLIRTDGGTQSRVQLNDEVVSTYAEQMLDGVEFPAITVFHDGSDHWLADGFHRYFATVKAGFTEINADVRPGTRRDAILHSLGANARHGLNRTNADKRKSVETLLADPEWAAWSDREVAKACGVSHPFVARIRNPEVATKQQESRDKAAARKVESDSTPAPAKQPQPLESDSTADSQDEPELDVDPIELMEDLQADNERLQGHIKALEADDTKAEMHKLQLQLDHAKRQQHEAMEKAQASQKREVWTKRQLMRCGKAVGEDDPEKIAAAVEAMARQNKKGA